MLKSSLSRKTLPAWAMLGAGLLATVLASLQVKQGIEQDAVRQFAVACDQVTLKIQERLGAYALVLRGGAALFAASKEVERGEWRAYVETLQTQGRVPGVQGIGFAQVIPADQLATHIARIRGEGFPDYTVNPPGKRAIYTSIIYLEPFRDRNLRAFGFDMYSEPVRRAAMEQARDSGEAALSGKVKLMQENGADAQAGTLMYVPVYRNGMPKDTQEQRRAALIGWTYSPYRMNDLMVGILRDWESHEGKTVDLHIHDGLQATPATRLFDSKISYVSEIHSLFYQRRAIAFNGHQWLLEFDHTSPPSGISYADAWVTLIGGLALSGLLLGLMLSVINTRANAQRIADKLTEEIRGREEVAHAASQYARSLIEASLDSLVTISPQGKIADVNQATEKLTGKSRLELIGTDFPGYFTEPDRAIAGYQQVVVNGFVTDYPLAVRHRDGHVTDVLYNASVYRNEAGIVLGVFAAARDVTERKRAQLEREQYFKFFNIATDLMGIADPNGAFKKINPAFVKTLGYSEAEILEKSFIELVHPDDRQATRDEMARQLQRGFTLDFENRYLCKDGSFRWLSWKANVKYDEGLTYATARDITELKKAEDKINELNRDLERRVVERTVQLEAANKALEAFSYSVSHDLRTPLRAIDGFSHILLEDYTDKLDEEGKRLLNVVRDNTSRMGQLIDDILKFSRAGRVEITFSEIDMEKLAREVYEELRPAVGHEVQVEIGHIPPALGDRAMMHQVFVNLLSNAIKFSRPREAARIGVGGSIEGDEAIYFVKDNGVGFDMQYVGKLFGVFQRLHSVNEFEGTGIGLAIVKRVITRHGGRVWAQGKVNEGATIYFALPTKEKEHG